MVSELKFQIDGKPRSLKRHRTGKHGRYDPSAGDKQAFLLLASGHKPEIPFTGPLDMILTFVFKRPKSHYRTGKYSEVLKSNAPKHHTSTPDLDNLVKFVCDALNKEFFVDDKQVRLINAIKVYGANSATVVDIYELRI